MGNFVTFHSMNIMLWRTVKNTEHVIGTAVYSHLFEKWVRSFAYFGQSSPASGEQFIYPRRNTCLRSASHICTL